MILANLFAALFAGALALGSAPLMLAVLFVDTWFFANPHLVATYTRIRAISPAIRTHWFLIFVAPLLIAVILTVIALAYETAGLFAVYFAAQAFHVARQSYGIARRHELRPSGRHQRLPCFLIHIFPLWGYLHRSAQAPGSFLGYPIWLPPVPQELANSAGVVAVAAFLYWIWRLFKQKGQAQRNGPFNGFVFSHLLVSFIGYFWIGDITVGWLVVNVWHNIQYLIFVHRQGRSGAHGPSPSRPSWPEMLKATAVFFIPCAVLGAAVYGIANGVGQSLLWLGFPTVLIAHFVLNFHHYLADSLIWKRRRAPVAPVAAVRPLP